MKIKTIHHTKNRVDSAFGWNEKLRMIIIKTEKAKINNLTEIDYRFSKALPK